MVSRLVVIAAVIAAGAVVVTLLGRVPGEASRVWALVPPSASTPARTAAKPATAPSPLSSVPPAITFPQQGAGSWTKAPGRGPVAGESGTLLRYQVAVERGIVNVDAREFGQAVERILADPRSWIGTGRWRFQRVGPADDADFTVYLATPVTRDQLCASVYDRYTSCRNGDRVVLNVARWTSGAAAFDAALPVYRQYLVNHEVGHRLGQRHQRCPGRGRPAPVMQQQTLGLHGCRPQPWPMPQGRLLVGPPGEYGDAPPRDADR